MDTADLFLHAELIAGKRLAVGWGAPARLPFVLMQAPYRFAALVDEGGILAGAREFDGIPVISPSELTAFDSDQITIVLLAPDAYGDKEMRAHLLERIAAFGHFKTTTTYLPARDDPLLAVSSSARGEAETRWQTQLQAALAAARAVPREEHTGHVALWIHRLCKGGAERQIVLLALGLRRLGREVDLFTLHDDLPEARRWAEELASAGVRRHYLPKPATSVTTLWPELRPGTPALAAAESLAPHFMLAIVPILQTYLLLRQHRPEALISYLDDGNLIAGYAAVIAGVPHILLSGRSAEPNIFTGNAHFSAEKSRMHGLYRALLDLPGVNLSNNSHHGAQSYAHWLDLPPESVDIIPNAVENSTNPPSTEVARANLGIAMDTPLILGIMRLDEAKQPLVFVRVIAEIAKKKPNVRAILVGDGPQRARIIQEISRLGLAERLQLAGLSDGCETHLAAADLLLLTSRIEGMPNVVLEAQLAGKPVVATDVGGVREALHPPLFTYLCGAGVTPCLAERCLSLLSAPELASELGMAAAQYMHDKCDPEMLARRTLTACLGTQRHQQSGK